MSAVWLKRGLGELALHRALLSALAVSSLIAAQTADARDDTLENGGEETRLSAATCRQLAHTILSKRRDIVAYVRCVSDAERVPFPYSLAVVEIESGFSLHARGGDGEVGLMQVLPSTAHLLGYRGSVGGLAEARTNIRLGVRYLAGAYRLAKGDLCTTLMKYRAGHAQGRFSVRSVEYCRKARAILRRDNVVVEGALPQPSFGFGTAFIGTSTTNSGTCLRRSFAPGAGFKQCLQWTSGVSQKTITRQRQALFGRQ